MDRIDCGPAPLRWATMVFPLSADRAASVGALEAARGAIFRVPSGLGPASRLRLSVSIPVPSRLIGGSGHPTSPLQGALHPARWRRIAVQAQRHASPDL